VLSSLRLRRSKTAFAALVATCIGLSQFVPIGEILTQPLETRFSRAVLGPDQRITGIIALGGDLRRIMEAVKLVFRFPHAKLVIAGYGEKRAHDFARAQGLAEEILILETRSQNTFENALFTKALVDPKPGERWLLVTSAWHMPRAVGCFRKAGFSILPWPLLGERTADRSWFPFAGREWLGLLVYWLIGRTDALFPGPSEIPR
jgi:uncharacterized SAM-binding protein YcdF (DUF218 family)